MPHPAETVFPDDAAPSSLPGIATVVLHYQGLQHTLDCIDSLLASEEPPAWLIVVNNASPEKDAAALCAHLEAAAAKRDTTLQRLSAASPKDISAPQAGPRPRATELFFIQAAVNKGYAGGNNLGMTLALALDAEAVWLLNNDTIVDAGALKAMRRKLFACARPGLCGSLVLYMDGKDSVQCRAGGKTSRWTGLSQLNGQHLSLPEALKTPEAEIERSLNFIYGASVMASRAFIEKVGLLDERYFMYCEEQDWAFRANGRFDLVYASGAVVKHREGVSTGWPARAKNSFAMRNLIRSRFLLTAKHNPAALPVVALSFVFAAVRLVWRKLFQG